MVLGPVSDRDRGIIYAYTGFQGPIDMSGEASNARRDVPRAVLTSLALSAVVYILLQVVFIGAVPGRDLVHGWSGVDFSSPFAELAVAVDLTWLSWILYADAIASPAGSLPLLLVGVLVYAYQHWRAGASWPATRRRSRTTPTRWSCPPSRSSRRQEAVYFRLNR